MNLEEFKKLAKSSAAELSPIASAEPAPSSEVRELRAGPFIFRIEILDRERTRPYLER